MGAQDFQNGKQLRQLGAVAKVRESVLACTTQPARSATVVPVSGAQRPVDDAHVVLPVATGEGRVVQSLVHQMPWELTLSQRILPRSPTCGCDCDRVAKCYGQVPDSNFVKRRRSFQLLEGPAVRMRVGGLRDSCNAMPP